MKKLVVIFVSVLISASCLAQSLEGKWTGILKVQQHELNVIFNVTQSGDAYSATLDSPDQGARDIPIDSVWLEGNTFNYKAASLKMEYTGEINSDRKVIDGELNQMGMIIPLKLTMMEEEESKVLRPQTPVGPFPYKVEEITFENTKDSITLAGTLTLPKEGSEFPSVILISGSGPQDRDEEIFDHRPFKVIADVLTKKGIAVLRFDDRGVGGSSGKFSEATTADFATDVMFAVDYLLSRDDIDASKIGLIGHSEGGLIAPMVASQTKDVSFIVLMAGPGIPSDELLILQSARAAQLNGVDEGFIKLNSGIQKGLYDIVKQNNDKELTENLLKDKLRSSLSEIPAEYKPTSESEVESLINSEVKKLCSPWLNYFIKMDPKSYLEKVSCPVLAINGTLDSQVLPKENLSGIEKSLRKSGNKNFEIIELPGLNHLFQEAETGAFAEYSKIEQTLSPLFIDSLTGWILKEVK